MKIFRNKLVLHSSNMNRLMKKLKDCARPTKKSLKKQREKRRRQKSDSIERRTKRNKMRDLDSKSRKSRERSSKPINAPSLCTRISSFPTS